LVFFINFDGLVKSPSAALRGNFVVAAPCKGGSRTAPTLLMILRALHGRGTLRVPDIGREASRPYNRNHRSEDFLRVHQF